jgi:hypothetical protein
VHTSQAPVEDKQAAPVSLLRRAAAINRPTEGATAMAAPKLRSEVHVPNRGTHDHPRSYKDALLYSPDHDEAGRSILNAGLSGSHTSRRSIDSKAGSSSDQGVCGVLRPERLLLACQLIPSLAATSVI